jgi:predicted phage-related endonuclease
VSTATVSKTKTTTAVVLESNTIALDGTNLAELIATLNDTKAALKVLEAQEKATRSSILELMQGAEEATIGGIVQVTLLEQTRSGIDTKMLKEVFPEAASACATSTTYTTLRVK